MIEHIIHLGRRALGAGESPAASRPSGRHGRGPHGIVAVRRQTLWAVMAACVVMLTCIMLQAQLDAQLYDTRSQLKKIMIAEAANGKAADPLAIKAIEIQVNRLVAWRLTLWTTIGAVVAGGGLAFYLRLSRLYREVAERQHETHRQNLELETVHLQELELRKTLDRERAMLELVLATVPQGVFWKNRDSVILGCNHALAEMLGLGHPDQLIGTGGPDDGESFTEQQLDDFRRDDLHVMQTGQPMLDYEEHINRADGVTLTLLTSKVPLRDPDGTIIGVLGASIDITQRKQLEHQLAHAQKMESIGQLAAGVAHEINTPTQFVSENMRFLGEAVDKFQRIIAQQEQFADPDAPAMDWAERHELLHDLKDEIDYDFINDEAPRAVQESLEGLERIRHIITAMREFSHPGENAAQTFDLNRVIRTSATVCRNRWKYIAELDFDLDPDLPTAYGHAGELGQVLVNLISNAADALEQNHPREAGRDATGRIRLTTRLTPRWIEIVVSDNGPGIPHHILPHVFDPFFTTKDVGQGTGQGLSITHHVVAVKHQGEIDVHNNPEGGATFTLRLPLEPPQPNIAKPEAA
ncbi:MAG: ATP-binding protein [Planctomycetota bacterium]